MGFRVAGEGGKLLGDSVPQAPFFLGLCFAVSVWGCGELQVELDDAEKDDLAAYVDRGGRYEVEAPAPRREVDTAGLTRLEHLGWDGVLGLYVEDGQVDYAGVMRDEDSLEALDGYLDLVASLDPKQLEDQDERLAFWLNAYNALVLRDAATQRAQDPAFSTSDDDFAFFQVRRYIVGGELYSLDQIEHGVIRGDRAHASVADLSDDDWAAYEARHEAVFGDQPTDPRIHVGLNCAARSCPKLPSAAFQAHDLDAFLEARARLFVADPERGAGPQGISMLFSWFEPDFDAGPQGSARGFVEAHREDVSGVNFEVFLGYDWTLNGE